MNFADNFAFKRAEKCYSGCRDNVATVEGIGKKTLLLLFITLITSLIMIGIILNNVFLPVFLYPVATIFTVVVQIVICFSPTKAKGLSIPYAISEGLTIGVLCGILELALPSMVEVGTVGTYANILEWISDEEAERILREGV